MKKLYGLVVSGGLSTRMGKDKGQLKYYDIEQRYYIYRMLEVFCDKVFISCNHLQAAYVDKSYKLIIDNLEFEYIGPMAALLSAFKSFPQASFFVIGCDYPFITEIDLNNLNLNRSDDSEAVCYLNSETNFEEPLLAIYENSCLSNMLQNFNKGNYSLRHFLSTIHTKKIIAKSLESLTSIDTMEEYQEVLLKLKTI